ncbi:hypothetical protein RKD20_009461 [Streptomyces sp. SLBN-8D4]
MFPETPVCDRLVAERGGIPALVRGEADRLHRHLAQVLPPRPTVARDRYRRTPIASQGRHATPRVCRPAADGTGAGVDAGAAVSPGSAIRSGTATYACEVL